MVENKSRDEKKPINPNEIAEVIRQEMKLWYGGHCFFVYKNGVYRPVSNIKIRSIIKPKLGSDSRARLLSEVEVALSIDTYAEPDISSVSKLNFLNGMLDTETWSSLEHSPKILSTVQFNAHYSSNATCPLFEKAVYAWLESEDKVALLQEFLGYCLTQDVSHEKILFLVGSGANGKSTLVHVITDIFGEDNCSAVPLDKIGSRFCLAEIEGKALNITSEIPSKSTLCDDVLKQVVSGDRVQAEEKFQKPFVFKPYAKFIVACNEIPRTEDKSNAIYRRLLILRFNRTFTAQEQDRKLKDKLSAEKSGIVNWMLAGLKRLRERGCFQEPAESTAEIETYRRENNILIPFVEEECEVHEQAEVRVDELYKRYQTWCYEGGLKPMTKLVFGKSLKEHLSFGQAHRGSSKDRYRVWIGLSLK